MNSQNPNIRYKYARTHISNAVFYIPFCYYFVVRIGTVPKLLSWMLIYLMPTAFYSAVGYSDSWGLFAANYILLLLATFSLYEYGYIINDTISILREEQPAIRLYDYNFAHFARWKSMILATRLSYAILALAGVYMLNPDSEGTLCVEITLAVMCVLFAIYNAWRSRNNVWLYPLLVSSRYLPFMLLFPHHAACYILLLLSFPLLNAIERFSMPRYRWPLIRTIIPDETSKTRFRVIYYAVVIPVTSLVLYVAGVSYTLLIPIGILFVYRLILLFWLRKHQPANYLNG